MRLFPQGRALSKEIQDAQAVLDLARKRTKSLEARISQETKKYIPYPPEPTETLKAWKALRDRKGSVSEEQARRDPDFAEIFAQLDAHEAKNESVREQRKRQKTSGDEGSQEELEKAKTEEKRASEIYHSKLQIRVSTCINLRISRDVARLKAADALIACLKSKGRLEEAKDIEEKRKDALIDPRGDPDRWL